MIKKDTQALNRIYETIGLCSKEGNPYGKRIKKFQQIDSYLEQLIKAVGRLSKKRQLLLVDCASGKSYLSFVANYYLTEVMGRDIRFICIDYNQHVMEASQKAAEKLGYTNMTFICDDIFKVKLNESPDIVYSLHACDTATDMTIAKGVLEEAKYIMTVSCCQHSVRRSMKKHPLGAVTRHGIYKERLGDMVADSMRSLLLESKGYKVDVFDYVSTSETPKNVMVRAMRIGEVSQRKAEQALKEYDSLESLFHTAPQLKHYISIFDPR